MTNVSSPPTLKAISKEKGKDLWNMSDVSASTFGAMHKEIADNTLLKMDKLISGCQNLSPLK